MKWSVVELSRVRDLTHDFRVDADFFKPEYLEEDEARSHYQNEIIENFAFVTDGQHGYHEVDPNSEISHLTAKNAKNWFANKEGADPLAKWVDDKNKRSSLEVGDIILSTRGSVGYCSLVKQDCLPANIDQDVARIKFESFEKITPNYLLVYLNSRIGQDWIKRNCSGMVQQGLSLEKVRLTPVPVLSSNFQKVMDKAVETAYELKQKSNSCYTQAQTLLLKELDLLNWQPKHQLSYVKTFSDTQTAERFDAEYFQPKYEEVDAKILSMRPSVLGDLCSHLNYGTVPTSPYAEKGVPYIKGLNLVNGFVKGKLDLLENTKNLPSKFFTKENDIIISQMGTVGKAGIVTKNQEDFLFASFTIRARLNNFEFIDPYVLTLYINEVSRPYYLLRKIAQASVRQNTDLPTLKALPVPTISNQMQESIKQGIIESYELKQKSKSLLEIAKTGVEKAIETTEAEATQWMTAEIDKLDVSLELTN